MACVDGDENVACFDRAGTITSCYRSVGPSGGGGYGSLYGGMRWGAGRRGSRCGCYANPACCEPLPHTGEALNAVRRNACCYAVVADALSTRHFRSAHRKPLAPRSISQHQAPPSTTLVHHYSCRCSPCPAAQPYVCVAISEIDYWSEFVNRAPAAPWLRCSMATS